MGGFHLQKSYRQLVRHSGNQLLFTAVELSILATRHALPLHLHVEGLRGTGKTTILRAARGILPEIVRVRGCLYNCDPHHPHCPEHRHLAMAALAHCGVETIPMPFLEISHSAKVATVVGSIDLDRLTQHQGPTAAILPGTLAQAHRGIVLVDEINRLVDTNPEIADVLLDVMGTKPGRLQIEEVGLARIELPISVTVWAASNPDEDPGPLDGIRRQLADRFDLCVGVKAPSEIKTLSQILTSSVTPDHAPPVNLPQEAIDTVARLYVERNIESVRAAEAILIAARMHCLYRGASTVATEDILAGATLALRHRVSPEALLDIINSLHNESCAHTATEQKTASASVEQIATTPVRLLSRLMDVFKTANPHSPGGPHIAESSSPHFGTYRHVNVPITGRIGEEHKDARSVAPPLGARRLADIPLPERVTSEEELPS